MVKLRVFLTLVLFAFAAQAQQPAITSFIPETAPSGALVTINGTNFNDTASKNHVYFGGVRAVVTAATTTSLTVQVPAGAANERIKVIARGLTATSQNSFNFVFAGPDTLTSASISTPSSFILKGGTSTHRYACGDIDGDGLADLVTSATTTNGGFYIARNVSTPGSITFAAPQSFTLYTVTYSIALGDLDGDGLLDVVLGASAGTLYVLRNTSTPGNISFATASALTLSATLTGTNFGIEIADLDNDGRSEIVYNHTLNSNFSIFRNTSTGAGNMSFANAAIYNFGVQAMHFNVNDFDRDGLNDIVAVGNTQTSIMRNTSSGGNISFSMASLNTLAASGITVTVRSKDLNGDKYPDIVIGSGNTVVSIIENTSTPGNINFTVPQQIFLSPGTGQGCEIEDLNGDGINDIVALGGSYVSILQGTGATGPIVTSTSFMPLLSIYNGISTSNLLGGAIDFDKDGRKDLFSHMVGTGNYLIRRFIPNCESPYIYVQPKGMATCGGRSASFSVSATGTGTVTYQWRKNGVNIPGANSSTYNIASVSAADTGSYTVVVSDSCVVNALMPATTSSVAKLMISAGPYINTQPAAVQVCGGRATFSVDVLTAGAATYQWRRNGNNIVGADQSTYMIVNATVANAGNYSVVITDSCGQTTSANAALDIVPITAPDVSDASICGPGTYVNLFNNISSPSGTVVRWYDDAALVTAINTGANLNMPYYGTDTLYVRNEQNNLVLSGAYSVDHIALSGDDRSVMALTQKYYYYTGDVYTVRYDMPGLTNGTSFAVRDALVSTYNGSGTLYSLGSVSTAWGSLSTTSQTTTHIWQMDSALNVIGSGVALNGAITSLAYGTGRFMAGGEDYFLYRFGSTIYKINPVTGFVTTLTTTATNFLPIAAEGWASSGHAEIINGNHYITYRSSSFFNTGLVRYHVEGNRNELMLFSSASAIFNDLTCIAKAPWYNRWYFKMETGTVSTASFNIDEVAGYFDAPARWVTTGCISPVDTVYVVSTLPAITQQPLSKTVCSGTATSLSVAATPAAGLTYQWYKNGVFISGASNSTYSITNASLADSGKYHVQVSNACTSIYSDTVKLSVVGVNITGQPTDIRNCAGEAVALNVTATGRGTLTYQWRKNNVNIGSANSATYNIAALAPSDTGTYTVVVNDSCNLPVTSTAVKVAISNGPLITNITPNSSVCKGNNITLSVTASGNGTLTYVWRKGGTPISGANSASYIINNASANEMGTYSVSINDNCGQTISANVVLTLQIITPPSVIDRTLCASGTTFSHTNSAAVPTGYITQWYDDDSLKLNIGSGTSISRTYFAGDTIYARNEPISNLISGVYSVDHNSLTGDDRGGIAATQDYFYYTCDNWTVRYRMPDLTNGTSLTLRDGLVSTYGGTGTVYSLGTASLPWGTGAGTATHLWRLDSNMNAVAGSAVAFNGSVPSITASFGMLAGGNDFIIWMVNNTIYKIIPGTGLVTTLSTNANQLVAYSTENWTAWGYAEMVGSNHYIYYRSNSGIVKYHVESNTNTNVFLNAPVSDMGCLVNAPWYNRWYFHFEGGTPETLSSGFGETAGYCDAPMRWANNGCYSNTDTIYITLNVPVITQHPQPVTRCTGNPAMFTVAATGTGLTYQWKKNGINISGTNNDTFMLASATLADSADYTVLISSSCGSVLSNPAKLTMKGISINTHPANTSNCPGEPTSLSVTAAGNGTLTYQWKKNGANVPGGNSATLSFFALSPADTGNYTVLVGDSCSAPVLSNQAYLRITNGPVISAFTPSQTVCTGAPSTILSVTASGTGSVSYQWNKNGIALQGAVSATYTISNMTAADTGNYTVTINDYCGQATSAICKLSLQVVAAPVVNDNSVCSSGNSVTLTNTVATPPGYTTTWYDNAALTVLIGTGTSIVRTISVQDTFYVRNEQTSTSCYSAVDMVVVTITSSNTWTGASNTNWFNATNWSCGVVPNSASNATIPAGPANMPVINNGLTANVLNLNLAAGATLSMLGSSGLSVFGDLNRAGTLTCPAGLISFNKTSGPITIPGGSYYNIAIAANASGATLTGSIALNNTFTFNGNCLVKLDTCNLTQYNFTTSAVTGAGLNSYFVVNKTGRLRLAGVGTGSAFGANAFANIGISTYNPLGITNTGTTDTFSVSLIDSVTNTYTGTTPSGSALAANVIGRSWIVAEATAGGSVLTIVPGWVASNEKAGFNRSSCYVAQYNTTWAPGTAGTGALSGSNYFKSQTGYTTTGIFGVGSNNALPVQLIGLTATRQYRDVSVNWSTASETNNSRFVVEVSADGKTYHALGDVKGNGTSRQVNQYQYLHAGAANYASAHHNHTLYYRLVQVDFNGQQQETHAVPVHFEPVRYQVSVVPNPFVTDASLHFSTDSETSVNISVTDVNGKEVASYTRRLTANETSVPLAGCENLSAGVYFVHVTGSNNEVNTFKLVKQ